MEAISGMIKMVDMKDVSGYLTIGAQLLTPKEKKIITEIAMQILGPDGFKEIEPKIREFINTEYNDTMYIYASIPIKEQINEVLDKINLNDYPFITKEILEKLKGIRLVDESKIDYVIKKHLENLKESGN